VSLKQASSLHEWFIHALEISASFSEIKDKPGEKGNTHVIISETLNRISQLLHFRALAFMQVDEETLDFNLTECSPPEQQTELQHEIDKQIEEGTFGWTLNQTKAVVVTSTQGEPLILHAVGTRSKIVGMFVGLLADDDDELLDAPLNLLSLLLFSTANALTNHALYQFINQQKQDLEKTVATRTQQLTIANERAETASNTKSQFLANMSHEIRTPLSGIIGFTELLQGTQLSKQQQDYPKTIHKSSINLLEIINDIHDLSKIEPGKVEISSSEFNLVDINEDIINLLSQTALDKNIERFYRIEKDLSTIIHTDSFRVHQILTNLIGNAIKFTDKGYVYLQVTKGDLDSTKTSIKFTVSDTGIGMSSDVKTKLFKAFTQADTSITRRFGGTGLGLVISRKLTLLMKGEIGFESTEGEGSTFCFCVPVTSIPQEQKKSELSNKKIAVVCNHFIAKQAFKTLLASWQCSVSDYVLDDLDTSNGIKEINQSYDIVIVLLSNKDLNQDASSIILNKLNFSIPSFLIASTQSHTKLKNLQQHIFNAAVFTSEKTEVIKQKLINTLDKNSQRAIAETTNNNAKSTLDLSNVNIMVVDDNEINLRLVEILLKKHRAHVTAARLGTQAIDYASKNFYDIIFMDLHMPGLDGYETAMKIRESTPGKQPVIIALTANALPQEKEKVIKSGMNGILIKPINDAILQKVINQWVLKKPINTPEINNTKTKNTNKPEKSLDHEKNVFSIALAKEFTGGNEELAYELFNMLRNELEEYNKAISTAVKNNDLKKLNEQVHKLHGASRCCGTTELKKTSSHIENLIHKNINFDIEKETRPLLIAIKNVADYKITAAST